MNGKGGSKKSRKKVEDDLKVSLVFYSFLPSSWMAFVVVDGEHRDLISIDTVENAVWKLANHHPTNAAMSSVPASGKRSICLRPTSTQKRNSSPRPARFRSYHSLASARSSSASAVMMRGKLKF